VTVFFVLSGFLITAVLLEELERSGTISMGRFYARRARRLLPALIATTVAVAAFMPTFGPLWLSPQALYAVVFYYANWMPSPEALGAMGATWSLSVEEQFYLVWPLMLVLLVRWSKRALVWVALVGAVASVAVRLGLVAAGAGTDRVYMGTDSVAFALLAGAALAAWKLRGREMSWGVGWVALGAGLLLPPLWWSYEDTLKFAPLLGALAGVLFVVHSVGTRPLKLFQGRVLVWLGRRSYGIYLWHFPITFLLRHGLHLPWYLIVFATLPASLGLAEASYRWIEQPFLYRPSAVEDKPRDVGVGPGAKLYPEVVGAAGSGVEPELAG
jgi:peptidoglycan/LPS O-acetylase OafA/YrhL